MKAWELAAILSQYRYDTTSEDAFQRGIAEVGSRHGIAFEREVRLDDNNRIDFVHERVGVEVKIGGGLSPLIRQLHRYAQFEQLDELLVISSKAQHSRLPDTIGGKGIVPMVLLGGFL